LKPPLFRIVLLHIVLFFAYQGYAQRVDVQVEAKPLGELLTSFHQDYDIQVSFNAQLLNKCLVTTDQYFESPYKALDYLTEVCDCNYKMMDGVFVITKTRISKTRPFKTHKFIYQGKIVDKINQEKLSYATILIDKTSIMTDSEGNFTYQSEEKKANLLASHVGYFVLDTIINADDQLYIELSPSITELQEVTVLSTQKIKMLNPEQKSGLAKLNNRQTPFLPGNNNNSLFSFLRLQPGIMASGEQNNGYILWGGKKGESHILFDGITIFNTSNYNDRIGAINPLFIKDIEVLKGGYNVEIGDRLGGVVNINSKSGNEDTTTYEMVGTQKSFNGYLNKGITSNSSIQLGARVVGAPDASIYSESLLPTAIFIDVTSKYTHQLDNGDHLSLTVLANLDMTQKATRVGNSNKYKIHQRLSNLVGGSMNYIKPWKKIGRTNVKIAYSEFATNYSFYSLIVTGIDTVFGSNRQDYFDQRFFNNVQELSLRADHALPASRYHQFSFGANITQNSSKINHGVIKKFRDVEQHAVRLGAYIKDEISLLKCLVLRLGIRADIPLQMKTRLLIQPRIEAIISPSRQWKINIAHGVYNQFLTENTLVDVYRNYTYHWSLTNNQYHPVPEATHTVLGASGRYRYWSCRLEAYYKQTKNTLQYSSDNNSQIVETSFGKAYNYGLDAMFAAHYKNQQIWIAYTLSKSEVQFGKNQPITRAPQDQRHEFKVAGMFNWKQLFCSVNYVYGSGFPNIQNLSSSENIRSYSRLDIGALCRFKVKDISIDFGFSILNVLATYNIQYNNLANFPRKEEQYAHAMPFNFTFFAHFRF
jgi:hypothetical protein